MRPNGLHPTDGGFGRRNLRDDRVSIRIVRRSPVLLRCYLLTSLRAASAESIMVRSLDELVTPADFIARVTIVSDNTDHTWTWRTG